MNLKDFLIEAKKQGATEFTTIAYKDMNFSGIDTGYDFDSDSIDYDKDTDTLLVRSAPWEPCD